MAGDVQYHICCILEYYFTFYAMQVKYRTRDAISTTINPGKVHQENCEKGAAYNISRHLLGSALSQHADRKAA